MAAWLRGLHPYVTYLDLQPIEERLPEWHVGGRGEDACADHGVLRVGLPVAVGEAKVPYQYAAEVLVED